MTQFSTKIPCLSGVRDRNAENEGVIFKIGGSENFRATTEDVIATCFSACSIFRDLSKTTGRNPQQSTLGCSVSSTNARSASCRVALSQCSDIFAKGQDSISIDRALSCWQQAKKTMPLNHTAIVPARIFRTVLLILTSITAEIITYSGMPVFN